MAQIVTVKNGTTNEIQYPRTVKSALLNDDGTPLNPPTRLELDTKVDTSAIVNNLTTGGATNVLSAEQGKVINSAIGQLQTDISNIDVSWDGVAGKPATFTPAAHTHNEYMPTGNAQAYNNYVNGIINHEQLLWNHGNIIVQSPSASGTPMISFHSQGATAVGLYEDGCRLYTTGSDGRNTRRLLDTDDYNSLFQSVVNGKQAVVNAINGSLGYDSGLTTSNTHDDYAWWIQNKVNGVKDVGFERMMGMYAAAHFVVANPPAIPYSKNISVSSVFSHKNTAGDKSYYSDSLTLPAAGTYLLIDSTGTVRADTRGYLTSVGSMTQIAAYSYYYMSGIYYYGSLFKVTNPGIFYNTSGSLGDGSRPRIKEVIELTPQSLQWLAGTIN